MILNLRIGLTLLFFGFVAGIAIVSLFDSGNNITPKTAPIAKEIKKEVNQIDKREQERVLQFEKKTRNLEKVVTELKQQLSFAKTETSTSISKIRKLTTEKESGNVYYTSSGGRCDSLVESVHIYVRQNKEKDSLYDLQINGLEEIVQVKDSVINIKQESNNGLRSLIERSIDQQNFLQKENGVLRKMVKKERLKRKLLSVGMLIITGIATSFILK